MSSKVIKNLKIFVVLSLFVVLVSCGAASSGGGSGSSGGGSSTGDDDSSGDDSGSGTYVGTSSLSGKVYASKSDLSKVYTDDNSIAGIKMQSQSIKYKAQFNKDKKTMFTTLAAESSSLLPDGEAELYVILNDGSMHSTGFTSPILNGDYSFENIDDDRRYVVVVRKQGETESGSAKLLEQSAFVYIPPYATNINKEVTESTAYIVAAIIERVRVGAASEDIDLEQLNNTLAIIAQVLTDSITNGEIVVGTRVREIEVTEVKTAVEYTIRTEEKEAYEQIENNEAVRLDREKEQIQALMQKEASELTADEAKQLAKYVWGVKMSGASDLENGANNKDGGIPDFFITLFAEGYRDELSMNLQTVATAFNKAYKGGSMEGYSVNTLKDRLINDTWKEIEKIYIYHDGEKIKDDGTIVTADPALTALFPATPRYTKTSISEDSTKFNVLQIVKFIQNSGLMEPEKNDGGTKMDQSGPPFNEMELMVELGLFNPKTNQVYFLEKHTMSTEIHTVIGKGEWQKHDENGPVFDDDGNPVMEEQDVWGPTRALFVNVELLIGKELDTPDVYLSYISKTDGSKKEVKLTKMEDMYKNDSALDIKDDGNDPNNPGDPNDPNNTGDPKDPKVNDGPEFYEDNPVLGDGGKTPNPGPGTMSLKSMLKAVAYNKRVKRASFKVASGFNESDYRRVRFELNPWSYNQGGTDHNGTIVKDFKSGTATLIAKDESEAIKSETITLVGIEFDLITWISPKGPDMSLVKSSEDANNMNYHDSYEPEIKEEGFKPKLVWTPATTKDDEDIPEGYQVRYSINLELVGDRINHSKPLTFENLPECPITTEREWEKYDPWYQENKVANKGWRDVHGMWAPTGENGNQELTEIHGFRKDVWSTWDDNRTIGVSSVELPMALPATTYSTEGNYRMFYEVHIRPVLVKKNTQEISFEGAESRTEFYIYSSEQLDQMSWSVALKGTVTMPRDFRGMTRTWNNFGETEMAGKWKIGIFKTGYTNSEGYYVNWNEDDANANVAKTPIVYATLGTNDEIAELNRVVPYQFDPINYVDDSIARKDDTQIILWYDQENANTNDNRWQGYGDPKENKLDFRRYSEIENRIWGHNNYRLRY
jgi:hypothetical protein